MKSEQILEMGITAFEKFAAGDKDIQDIYLDFGNFEESAPLIKRFGKFFSCGFVSGYVAAGGLDKEFAEPEDLIGEVSLDGDSEKIYKLELDKYERDLIFNQCDILRRSFKEVLKKIEEIAPEIMKNPSSSGPRGKIEFELKKMEKVMEILK